MGSSCSYCRKREKRKIVLLLVGLDNAGKTRAAKGLAGEPVDYVVPTVGFSIIKLKYGQYTVKIYDLGGAPSIRGIWHKYFVDVHGVIFVIDSSDIKRLDEAKSVLHDLLSNEKVMGKPVLLLANKQDNEDALDEIEVVEKLELEALVNSNRCPTLVECCAASECSSKSRIDPGIKKGYQWLLNYIVSHYKDINTRVERDVQEQQTVEKQLLMQKIERIRVQKEKEMASDDDAIESYSEYQRKNNPISLDCENDVKSLRTDAVNGINTANENVRSNRPKSAVQLVRQQLILNNDIKSRIRSAGRNKTHPLNLYNVKMPHSAELQRKIYAEQRRTLRSAGDSLFVRNDTVKVASRSGPSGDNFEIICLEKTSENLLFSKVNNGLKTTDVSFSDKNVHVEEQMTKINVD